MTKQFVIDMLLALYKEYLIGVNQHIDEIYEIINNHTLLDNNDREFISKQMILIDSLYKSEDLTCHTDGSIRMSRGSKTEIIGAGGAFVVKSQNKTIMKDSFPIPASYQIEDYIQRTSAPMAEYQAVLSAILSIKSAHPNPSIINLTIYTDAQTLYKQLNQESKTKHPILIAFRKKILLESSSFKSFTVVNVPRENNKEANRMCIKALGFSDKHHEVIT